MLSKTTLTYKQPPLSVYMFTPSNENTQRPCGMLIICSSHLEVSKCANTKSQVMAAASFESTGRKHHISREVLLQ